MELIMAESVLSISNIGFPPLSLRGCTQELSPIPNGEMKKTVNGDLVYIKHSEIQKYKTVIRCKDTNCPALGNLGVGSIAVISCIQNIWQQCDSATEEIELSRTPADNSIVVINNDGTKLKYKSNGRKIQVLNKTDGEIFISFRPCLTMLITDFKTETDEWNLSTSWSISAVEM